MWPGLVERTTAWELASFLRTAAVCCGVRPEQSSSFSDVVALSATAPDPINDSRCFLPWQWVLWSHHLTPHGGLRPVCNSNSKGCKKATNGLGDFLEARDRSPEFGVGTVLPLVLFAHAPVDEVARVTIFSENPSKILGFGNLVLRFTALRLKTPTQSPYATAFVDDWVVAVEVQYLRRVRRFPEHLGL
ncbi:hypothetical protein SprV_0100116400 [Sparganum proliferum]